MSIRKIISLKDIGRFESFKASGDIVFKKYTLIYADNGTGKTTLCDVIRSLQTGNPDYILGRQTLGSTTSPEAMILLSNGTQAVFKNGAWTLGLNDVTIFDANYVSQNVHAGEVVESDHRRNLFRVIVGEEGVRLARRLEELEAEKKTLNTPIRDAEKAVKMRVGDLNLAAYLKLTPDPDIDDKIMRAERAVAAAEKADDIRRHRGFEAIDLGPIPSGLVGLVGETLDGVADQAERRLKDHVAHLSGQGAGRWLSAGMAYTDGEACPFCAQDIENNELIAAYRVCFSAAYIDLSKRLDAMKREVDEAFGPTVAARMRARVAGNAQSAAFWSRYFDLAAFADLEMDAIDDGLRRAHTALMGVIERKAGNLLEPVDDPATMALAETELKAVAEMVAAYEANVRQGNAQVEAQKNAVDVVELAPARTKLTELRTHKQRFEEPTLSKCAEYEKLTAQKKELEKEKAAARAALDAHTARVVTQYEGTLNKHLRNFHVGFSIQGTRADLPSGLPSSSYSILINGVPVGLGSEKTPTGEPSFKNTLSGGDRSALALSLFMSELERTTTPPEIAVILDDPFQSQDAFRRNATAFQIKRCGDRCGQVIVMSHDARFLKLVWDNLPPAERKALKLTAVGKTTAMSEWDIDDHVRSAHQAHLDAIQRYVADGVGDPRDIAQKLRPAVEGHCRSICPLEFPKGTTMGKIIDTIRNAGDTHPLRELLDDLEEVNAYSKGFHHAPDSSLCVMDVNEGELQAYASRVLRMTRSGLTT